MNELDLDIGAVLLYVYDNTNGGSLYYAYGQGTTLLFCSNPPGEYSCLDDGGFVGPFSTITRHWSCQCCHEAPIDATNFDSGDFSNTVWYKNDNWTRAEIISDDNYALSNPYSVRLTAGIGGDPEEELQWWRSIIQTDRIDLSTIDEINVSFAFKFSGYEWNERFWLQMQDNWGNWTIVKTFFRNNTEFPNNNTTYLASEDISGPFSSQMRFRLRGGSNAINDHVYIDNIVIRACPDGIFNKTASAESLNDGRELEEQTQEKLMLVNDINLTLQPNPVQNTLYLKFDDEEIKDFN